MPTGFLALVDDNIPQEGIASPDWVWIKERSSTSGNMLQDSVRGATKNVQSASTNEEQTSSNKVQSFSNNGFTVGDGGAVNQSTQTYVAWNWKAGGLAPKQTYVVKVVDDGGNKYRFDDFGTNAVTLSLQEGGTYTFDQSDSSNALGGAAHPLRFSTTSDGTHGSGSEYTVGVTTSGTPGSSGAKTVITVAHGAPTLYYYCSSHSGMGGQANTTATHGSTNLNGSIQSTVSANPDAGFSIVSYIGNGTHGTIGHGLSGLDMVIVKDRDTAENWAVWHTGIPITKYLRLNDPQEAKTPSRKRWNDTSPTSTVFSVGDASDQGDREVNLNDEAYIAYCFHSVEGYSKVGSYTGGGSNLPFVYTGFRPAFVLLKVSSTTNNWFIYDNKREGYNQENDTLSPNLTAIEDDSYKLDLLSNGFKIRGTNNAHNQSGQTFIYLAFAEQPFKFANAR